MTKHVWIECDLFGQFCFQRQKHSKLLGAPRQIGNCFAAFGLVKFCRAGWLKRLDELLVPCI